MKEKIPFYNIANMFFVGSVFICIIIFLFNAKLELLIDFSAPILAIAKDWSVVVSVVLLTFVYEIGFLLNRASSIVIEPILKKTKIWPKYQYDNDVSEISKKNPKFQSMITDLVLMRTHILLYSILLILSLFSPYKWFATFCALFIVIFILAGRKHNLKINKIREANKDKCHKRKVSEKGIKIKND